MRFLQKCLLLCVCVAKAEFDGSLKTCVEPGMIALTFDDGPSPNGGTESVLRVLREKGVKATFFVAGMGHDTTYLDSDERKQHLLHRIFREGHQIASHTWSHPDLTSKTIPEVMEDVGRLAKTVKQIIGVNMTAFRPPYGEINEEMATLIQTQFGYDIIYWSLDTMDWRWEDDIDSSLQTSYKHFLDAPSISKSISSFITLHHDPLPRSGELAAKAIDYIRMKGYRIVTVAECIGAPDYL